MISFSNSDLEAWKHNIRTIRWFYKAQMGWYAVCVFIIHDVRVWVFMHVSLPWSCALDQSHQLPCLTIIHRASRSASVLLWSLRTQRNNKWINLFSFCRRREKNNKHCVIGLNEPVGFLHRWLSSSSVNTLSILLTSGKCFSSNAIQGPKYTDRATKCTFIISL